MYCFLAGSARTFIAGEIKNPKHTVPLGIFLGVTAVLVLYISIQLVTQGVLGATVSAHKDAPLAAVANIVFGKWGAIIIIAASALSMLGALGGEILSTPRILFAGARDGLMPKPLAKVHDRYFTPYVAIAFYASLGLILAISGGFKQLATIASAALLIIYLGVVLSSVKLRRKDTAITEKTFRVPGGIIVPLLATAAIVWLLSNLSRQEFAGIGIFMIVFSIIYFTMKEVKKKKQDKGNSGLKD